MYNEDVDLNVRLRQAGWRVVFLPEAHITHHLGASSSADWQKRARMVSAYNESRYYYFSRFGGPGAGRRLKAYCLLGAAIRLTGWSLLAPIKPGGAGQSQTILGSLAADAGDERDKSGSGGAAMSDMEKRLRQGVRRLLGRPASPREVERAEQIFYLTYLRDGMTVFDVGANIGELTLLFSRFAAGGQVHAFEATTRGFAQLTAVCRASQRSNIILNHAAVTDHEGTVAFHVYDDEHLSWSSLAPRPLENYGISIAPPVVEEVPAMTLDRYCEQHGIEQIDLLKVDVEGAEYQVLRGARRLMQARQVRCITFEFGQTTFDMGNRPADLESLFSEMGYKVRNIVRGNPVFPGRSRVEEAQFSVHVATPK